MTYEEREQLNEIFHLTELLQNEKERLERLEHEAEREEWGPEALAKEGPGVKAEIQWLLGELRKQLMPGTEE